MDPIPSLDLDPSPAVVPPMPPPPPREAGPVLSDDSSRQREEAFSAEFKWAGKLLQPLAIEKYTIFLSHRTALGSPPLNAVFRDSSAFYPDAIRLLWVCSVDVELLRSLRSDPELMESVILDWAEKNAPIHQAAAACALAIRLWNLAHENRPDPRDSGAPQGKGDTRGN